MLSPFYKELGNDLVKRSLAQEMQLTPLSVQGSVGCVGPLVSVEFTAGEGAPTTVQNPCSHPVYPRSPKSRTKVKTARRLESWALVPPVLLTGSATWVGHYPPPHPVYPIVT